MANVGRGPLGSTLIGQGNSVSPTFASIGSGSGLTQHGVVIAEGNGAFSATATGTSGQILQSRGASADPSYSTATYPSTAGTASTILRSDGTNIVNSAATYPNTTTVNRILYSSATNTISEISAVNNAILSTNASGVPSLSTSLTNDYTFTSATAGVARNVTVSNVDNTSGSSAALFTASTAGTSSGDCYSRYAIGSTRSYAVGIDNSDTQSFKIVTANSGTVGPSGAAIVTRIDNSGNVTLPLNCCVQAYVETPTTDVTGDGTDYTIIFDAETFDVGSNFNTTTGTFTAPVAGKYLVAVQVSLAGLLNTHTSGVLSIVSTGRTFKYPFGPFNMSDATGQCYVSATQILNMAATNTMTVTIQVSNGTKVVDILDQNFGDFTNVSISLIS